MSLDCSHTLYRFLQTVSATRASVFVRLYLGGMYQTGIKQWIKSGIHFDVKLDLCHLFLHKWVTPH